VLAKIKEIKNVMRKKGILLVCFSLKDFRVRTIT
jgi:hypothetical protein